MKNIVFILLSVAFLSSCGLGKNICKPKYSLRDSVVVRDSVVIHDSTVIKVETKDSVVITEKVVGSDSLDCKENIKSIIRRGGDIIKVEVRNGKVYLDYELSGTISRFKEQIAQKDRLIEQLQARDNIQKTEITKVVKEKFIPWWVTYLVVYAALCTVFIILKFALKGILGVFL